MAQAELFFAQQRVDGADKEVYEEKLNQLAEKIKEADAIVVGGGSGFLRERRGNKGRNGT